MSEQYLITIYESYVNRIYHFSRQQYLIIVVLVSSLTFIAKGVIDLKISDNLKGIESEIYLVISIFSFVLFLIFLYHSHIIVVFAKKLQHCEKKMSIPKQISFYSEHSKGRRILFILFQFLPFILFFAISMFIMFLSDISWKFVTTSIGLHLMTIAIWVIQFVKYTKGK